MHKIFEFFLIVSLVILWWIAEWGIVSMAINNYAADSQLRECSIYILIVISILILLYYKPQLIKHWL